MLNSKLALALVAGSLAVAPALASADVVIQNPQNQQPTPPPPQPQQQQTPPPAQPAPAPIINNNNTQAPAPAPQPAAPAPAPTPTTNNTTVVTPAAMAQPETTTTSDTGVTATTETAYINTPVFSTGATVFAISYGAGVISAASTDTKSNDRLYVPVVGPWLALHDRIKDNNCGDLGNASCDSNTTAKVLLVVDGVFQAAGLLAMVDGVLDPGTTEVHHTATVAKNSKKVHFAPAPVGDHADPGFWAMGRF